MCLGFSQFFFHCNLSQCKFSKKLLFNNGLLFPIPGNPFIRKNSGVNPPAKRQKTSSSTPVSSMALSSVTVDPRDTNKTPKPIKPSPSNSTGNVSSQGNAGII